MDAVVENQKKDLTGGRLLVGNTILNLFGQVAPTLVAIFAIPLLIEGLGTDKFGVLTLAWVVIGYFSLFDLGLGRALTQLVSEKLGTGQDNNLAASIWTALALMLLLGCIGAVVVSLLTPWLVYSVLRIPESIQTETLWSFYTLALSIPVVISTAGLRGILEAQQRFKLINAIRIPMGVFMFVGPLCVLYFFNNLFYIIIVLVAGRLIGWVVYLVVCFSVMPVLYSVSLQWDAVGPLLRFGSWLTVSSVVGPLMVYLDRFLIGAFISISSVAYYATPYEFVTKLSIISGALVAVLFPAFATSFAQDRNRTIALFDWGVKSSFFLLFPAALIIVVFAKEGLYFWLGADFARNSTYVLQLLAIGVFVNNIALLPFTLLQSLGRPDISAKLHLIELPFYLFALWWLVMTFGIEGVALAWVLRAGIDMVIMFFISEGLLYVEKTVFWQRIAMIGLAALFLIVGISLTSLFVKVIFLSLVLVSFILTVWFLFFSQDERAFLVGCCLGVFNRKKNA